MLKLLTNRAVLAALAAIAAPALARYGLPEEQHGALIDAVLTLAGAVAAVSAAVLHSPRKPAA